MEQEKTMVDIINQQVNLDKVHVKAISDQIVNEFEKGAIDPFIFAGKLEFMLQTIEDAMVQIREMLIREIDVYGREGEQGIERANIKFRKKEAGIRYDFTRTEMWVKKNEELLQMKEEMKALENQLKAIHRTTTQVDDETGEIVELHPATRSSKTIIEITIPKQ
jgi:hypothetical protein